MSTEKLWFFGAEINEILSFAAIEYLSPKLVHKLYNSFESFEQLCKASSSQLQNAGLTEYQISQVLNRPKDSKRSAELLGKHDIKLCLIDDPEYPYLLKQITDPPLWLFYKGDLSVLNSKIITIVGTRKPSQYAVDALKSLLSQHLIQNIVVASGLAYGIDKCAHQIAVDLGGKTIAVLAGGLDNIYPVGNQGLAKTILESGGLLLSEYPPLSKALAHRFPIRNRILAGLAPLTFVVEAKIRSGTLITARAALDYNRDVMALPGDINKPNAEGGNYLISCGATPVLSETTLTSYYNLKPNKPEALVTSEIGKKILECLKDQSTSVDILQQTLNSPIELVLSELTELEILGLVAQESNGDYTLRQ